MFFYGRGAYVPMMLGTVEPVASILLGLYGYRLCVVVNHQSWGYVGFKGMGFSMPFPISRNARYGRFALGFRELSYSLTVKEGVFEVLVLK